MKKNYVEPQIEVIEIEIEDAVLSTSLGATTSTRGGFTTTSVSDGGSAW